MRSYLAKCLFLAAPSISTLASACSCPSVTATELYCDADKVFAVRVENVADTSADATPGRHHEKVVFGEVVKTYKGTVSKRVELRQRTAEMESSCAIHWDVGAVYLVSPARKDERISYCRTDKISQELLSENSMARILESVAVGKFTCPQAK